MNDTARIDRAIRLNIIAGAAQLALVAVLLMLVVTGVAHWEPRVTVYLVSGVLLGSLAFLTARSIRQDRDDPAGAERRFEGTANAFGAAVIVVSVVGVVGLIAWGMFG
jgi:hypothetical protein